MLPKQPQHRLGLFYNEYMLTLPHPFVLLRHGQSIWNLENRFTGWTDIELTAKGRQEALLAARLLQNAGFHFDVAFTSRLKRAVETLEILQTELRQEALPVQRLWQLNERHYGSLQGLNKAETAQKLGLPLVMNWRRSYRGRPPALEPNDPRHPRFDPIYADLPDELLPGAESLEDTENRLLPCWEKNILPAIQSGLRVLIVAHGNSLRALARYLEQIPPDDVPKLDIPTGHPLVYLTDGDGDRLRRYDLSAE